MSTSKYSYVAWQKYKADKVTTCIGEPVKNTALVQNGHLFMLVAHNCISLLHSFYVLVLLIYSYKN